MSNSLDSDQVRHFVGPDLGPNCLQRLSADGSSRHYIGLPFPNGAVCCCVLEAYMANSVALASDCLVHSVTMHTGLDLYKQKI